MEEGKGRSVRCVGGLGAVEREHVSLFTLATFTGRTLVWRGRLQRRASGCSRMPVFCEPEGGPS